MTKLKKVTALMLTLLLAFSSYSLMAFAVDFTDNDDDGYIDVTENPAEITVNVKFTDSGGTELADLSKVTPNDSLKARVYLGTNYYSAGGEITLFYDADFFTLDPGYATNYALTMNSSNSNVSTNKVEALIYSNASLASALSGTALDTGNMSAVRIQIAPDLDSEYGVVFTFDDSDWLFEIDLKVNADAQGEGSVFAYEDNICWSGNDGDDADNILYAYQGMDLIQAADLCWMKEAFATDYSANKVSVDNSVTFDANGGYFENETVTTKEVSGIVGSTDNVIPAAPTRDGYTFLGWTLDNADVFTNGETTFTMPVDTDVVYLAKWNENVIINFADTGTPALASYEVSGGTAWNDKPDVSANKEGYKFLYWEGEGVVNGQFPNNYPVATVDGNEYTYTAVWAKLVKISFDDDGGTFSPAVDPYYEGDDIYAGNDWDPDEVPTFDVTNYANDGITKEGYALVGWQVNGGEIITNFPDKYPAENTTYKAVWRPVNVRIIYVVDPTAQSPEDVVIASATPVKSVLVPYDSTYSLITYSDDDGEVTSWTDENGNSYVPGTGTVTVAAPLVSFTNGTPDIVYLIGIMNDDSHFATFNPDGGTWSDDTTAAKQKTVNVGDTITAPAETLSKSGYSFDGWTPALGTMGNSDVTFTAVWTPVDYTVKYMRHYDDNDIEKVDEINFSGDRGIEYPQDPEREGYEFKGWFTDKAGTTEFTTLPAETTFEVYAKWEIQSYTVTYDVDGGSAVTPGSVDVVFDADIPDEPDTAKEGYTLSGWVYTDEDDTVYTGATMPAYDLTATAQWTANTYKINYVKNDGEWIQAGALDYDVYTYGTDTPEVRDADDIRKTGSEFKNVTLDSEGNTVFTGDWAQILANAAQISGGQDNEYELTVYVQWDLNKYNLTVDLDGGEFGEGVTSPAREYYYGDNLPAMPAATKTGYSPADPAWVYTNTETGDVINPAPATMPEYDVTVTAQWVKNTYTINYDVDGGEAIDPASYQFEYDAVITSDPETSKPGYTFGGWKFTDVNGDDFEVTPGTTKMPASNLEAKAQWTANTYTLTIVPMGGTWTADSSTGNKTVSKVYDEAFTAVTAADIQKTGSTFDGVTLDEAGNEAFDFSYDTILEKATLLSGTEYGLTVYVKWNVNQYTIKFETNGGSEIADYTRDYGATVENLNQTKVPTKAGFVFDKWYADQALTTEFEVPSTMPVYDTNGEPYITIYAKYIEADTEYTIIPHLQKLDGTYTDEDPVIAHGVTGNEVSRETIKGTAYPDGIQGYDLTDDLTLSPEIFEIPATGGIYDLYLDRQSYAVTYKFVCGEDEIAEGTETTVVFGADVALDTAPEYIDGLKYKYSGVETAPELTDGKMPAEPVTVTYKYDLNEVPVKFYAYGSGTPAGSYDETPFATINKTAAQAFSIADALTDAGVTVPSYDFYKFIGWGSTAEGTSVDYAPDAELTPDNETALYARYKAVVKLVPVQGKTAIIERDGAVETWNTFGSVLPYGISADNITEPNDTVVTPEDYDCWYVYGLKADITLADYADYVTVTGGGTMTVEPTSNGYGTGSVIKVYDGDDLVEQFYVVVFGDIDGNGKININDSALLRTEALEGAWSGDQNRQDYKVKAADLDLNDKININDSALLRSVAIGDIVIDQTTGKAG